MRPGTASVERGNETAHPRRPWRSALTALAVAVVIAPGPGQAAGGAATIDEPDGMVLRSDSVAARLGGFPGILTFLRTLAAPAILRDPVTGPFFGHLSETPDDIEECLAMLLDHDLGGSSPHFGAELADGHQCRSSMTNIHRGRRIPDQAVDRFIAIVGEEAAAAGVAEADIQAVAKVLERYRGGVRNK